jgi:hypothetical protein
LKVNKLPPTFVGFCVPISPLVCYYLIATRLYSTHNSPLPCGSLSSMSQPASKITTTKKIKAESKEKKYFIFICFKILRIN